MGNSKKINSTSKVPTSEEKFYSLWGKETLKNNIENANIVLRQLITINTALLAGSVAFLSQGALSKTWHSTSMLFFLIGLILAFLGSIPYESQVQLNMPYEIKLHKEKALKSKRCSLWESVFFTICGLIIAALGVLIANNAQVGFREHALFLQKTQKNRLFSKPLSLALYFTKKEEKYTRFCL